ncbi:DNA translocase FtsK [Pseudovibrio axinellae]|uniref:DNA translocase FtsK n=1 Tax=Pseudovibrio axinellae TaxID=989403 RepID=A0A161V5N6_9HYPH|nr:DNA translocase FtsK [Pseudovibrio axinellae]KZL20149.1 DNA translocase FtsK [Pseudovibrio axinellae]SEQ23208.1 DNA segregation ATPase FtsK/SpoIIIE, S-DNA-T family [Pseudovibrio axinellae]
MRQAAAMQRPKANSVSLADTESPLKRFIKSNIIVIGGAAILVLGVCIAAALATWSTDDPSFNHATNAEIHNALGQTGAVVADLLMQTIGLATAVFLVPIFIWGWRLSLKYTSGITRKRFLTWFLGTTLFAGGLAAIPVPASWPLPTGLGGFLGDWIFSIPSAILPEISTGIRTLTGAVGLGLPATILLAYAAGLIGKEGSAAEAIQDDAVEDEYTPHEALPFSEDSEDDYESENNRYYAIIGALSHWKLMASSAIQRTLFKRKLVTEQNWQEEEYAPVPAQDGQDQQHPQNDYEEDQYDAEQPQQWDDQEAYEEEPAEKGGLISRLRRKVAARLMPDEDDGLGEYYQGKAPEDHNDVQFNSHSDDPNFPSQQERYPEEEWEAGTDAVQPAYEDRGYDEEEFFEDNDLQNDAHLGPPLGPIGIASPEEAAAKMAAAPPQQAARPAPGRSVPRPFAQEKKSTAIIKQAPFELPSIELLSEPQQDGKQRLSKDALEQNARILEGVLGDFGVRGEVIAVRPGPVVTLYELEPAPGIKSSRVIGLADDIARSMSAISARVAVIPGKNAIGIELPNAKRETVYLRELLDSADFDGSKAKLAMALGKTINGEAVVADLARMPHLLVAGTTGSGKSVSVNTMILSLLYRLTPEQCKLIMIDPKMLELSIYDGIPHLLTPVVTDPNKAVVALKWTVREMEDRYKKMSKMGVRNIDGYNTRIGQAMKKGERFTRTVQTGFDKNTGEPIFEEEELPMEEMPYIVVIVDEMADLMMVAGKDIEGAIQRLAQMARAAGIHLIMATQRPSVDVITGTIKANFPTRISFQVTSKIDSRTILGEMGAEQLLGMGDMLYMAAGGKTQRVHGPFVADDEVEDIVNHLKEQGSPTYLSDVTEESEAAGGYDALTQGSGNATNDLFDQAVAIVARDRKASTSYIQRRLSIGYNRAASLIERMEQEGMISPSNHAGKREILLPESDEQF